MGIEGGRGLHHDILEYRIHTAIIIIIIIHDTGSYGTAATM